MGERKNKDRELIKQGGLSGEAGPLGRICPDRHTCEGWMCIDLQMRRQEKRLRLFRTWGLNDHDEPGDEAVDMWRIILQKPSLLYGLPRWLSGKESACNVGDVGSNPGSGRSAGWGNGNSLQYFCLKNSMDRGAWRVTGHGATKSRTWLSDGEWTRALFLTLWLPALWLPSQKPTGHWEANL